MSKPAIRALTVCVGYDDFLQLTLPRTIQHVDKLLVITSSEDTRTQGLTAKYPEKVITHVTDVFYANGAAFNKGAAIEEGFDVLGRSGWILVKDADIVLPPTIAWPTLTPGTLYSPHRHIMLDVDGLTELPDVSTWGAYPVRTEYGHYGYFQLFHAADPVLQRRPWYDVDWRHAGGCDATFQRRWPKTNKSRMPFKVLHLGDCDANWFGRSRPRIDTQEVHPEAAARLAQQKSLHRKYGWCGQKKTGEKLPERLGSNESRDEVCHDQSIDKPKRRVKAYRIRKYNGKGKRI